ncbi:MAG: nuclear transport factor 2 family protein [Anaerolineae bacterium]
MKGADPVAWMAAYKQAWETLSPALIGMLFAENARYYITPFVDPLIGRAAVVEYWQSIASRQKDVQFSYTVMLQEASQAVCQWEATFTRPRSQKRICLNGVMHLQFDSTGCCLELREWWHRKEQP